MTDSWLSKYQGLQYEDGARGPDKYDCWGLCREVRHSVCGKALLPSWGHVRNDMPREFTRAYENESVQMEQCAAEVGAICAAFRGRLVIHVGCVVEIEGRLAILDISPGATVRWWRIPEFERKFTKVAYYRDRINLPEQT